MENKEITLDKIELVKDRTGVSYREAKEALEQYDGSVVDAIIGIEDCINESMAADSRLDDLLEDIKAAVRKGNVSRIVIKRNGEIILNLPVNVGLLGTVRFPWAMVAGVLAAFGTTCVIEMVKDNGDTVDLSQKATTAVETVVVKGGVVLDEVKDKGGDLLNTVVEKGGSVLDEVKDKGGDLLNTVVERSGNLAEQAKDTAETLVSGARSAAADLKAKVPAAKPEEAPSDDFDLSDLELDKVEDEKPVCCEAEEVTACKPEE